MIVSADDLDDPAPPDGDNWNFEHEQYDGEGDPPRVKSSRCLDEFGELDVPSYVPEGHGCHDQFARRNDSFGCVRGRSMFSTHPTGSPTDSLSVAKFAFKNPRNFRDLGRFSGFASLD